MQPPWSTATSTITLPGFIVVIISRVTSLGALAPLTNTAPTTKSARRTARATLNGVEYQVVKLPCNMVLRVRIRSRLISIRVTSAPIPSASWAAWVPTTPPPRMTTLAGRTPGMPPNSFPRPPSCRSRYWAPIWIDIRPATSLIGVSSGSVPLGNSTVS